MRKTPMWRRYQRLWGSNPAGDAKDELDFQFTMRIADLVRRGLSDADARRQAETEFGDVSRIRAEMEALGEERRRRASGAGFRDALRQDVAYGTRAIVRNPAFRSGDRLHPAASASAATSELAALGARFKSENEGHYPEGWFLNAVPMADQVLGKTRG